VLPAAALGVATPSPTPHVCDERNNDPSIARRQARAGEAFSNQLIEINATRCNEV